MKKLTNMVLMLCFILSGALCYTGGVARTEKTKGEGSTHTRHQRIANSLERESCKKDTTGDFEHI